MGVSKILLDERQIYINVYMRYTFDVSGKVISHSSLTMGKKLF